MPARAPEIAIIGLNYFPEPTGVAPYTAGLAHFLADAGCRVQVVSGLPHYPYWRVADGFRRFRAHERHGAVDVTRVWHPVPRRPNGVGRIALEGTFALHAGPAVRRQPDLVIAVTPSLLSVGTALRLRRVGRTAVGVVVHDLYGAAVSETGALGGKGGGAVRRLERKLLRGADGVSVIHESFRRSLTSLGVDDSRISTIRNWNHLRGRLGDVDGLRRRIGGDPRETIVLHAGNMGAKQGLENVVAAARLADERSAPVRFVMMGDGNQRTRLQELAEGVERIHFVDPLPDHEFEAALAGADLLLLNERPQVAEMCVPSKLTSYFASGRPVLAATNPSSAATSEIRASGGGVCVLPDRPDQLLDAAVHLGSQPQRRRTLGMCGQEYARHVLDESTARDAYLAWANSLLAGVGTGIPALEVPSTIPLEIGGAGLGTAAVGVGR